MAKKKEVTIDDLAMMVQRGFLGMNNNFGELKTQVGNIENKVNQIDRRLFSIEEDIADIKIKQYGDLLKRVNFIERKLGIASGR